ncbi:acyltransferase family protein [Isoalcanivorax beigongshangi]|uniref:Acyltransferase family protein n=1 Tax=Isoalcanivorax beigongshangi TaxID=3238810 RepID=A0ABV4AE01_9GAMM
MSTAFRTDINGLRAWAVLLVVLFHFAVPGFGAGFAGVDVFFVISGYLMAQILHRGLSHGNLSLVTFYASRVRRIYPALVLVSVACLVAGWFLLVPEHYMALGRHVRESLLFNSNHRYLSEAGYFDTAAESKWMLHTWSLSVEWQFYMLYPLLMWGLFRWVRSHLALLAITVVLIAASLGWSEWLAQHRPDEAFYGFFARAWELLAGGAVFHLCALTTLPRRLGQGFHWAGLGIIVLTACVVTPAAWPGLWALLPVLGAALVIIGRSESPLTKGRLWDWLGERSYSIYLWHWPLAAMLHTLGLFQSASWRLAALALALLLAELAYRFMERPLRERLGRRSNRFTLGGALLLLLVVGGSAQAVRQLGFPERMPEHVKAILYAYPDHNPRREECLGVEFDCHYGPDGPVAMVLAGDSHADTVANPLMAARGGQTGNILFQGNSACLTLPGLAHTDKDRQDCVDLGNELPDVLATLPGVPLVLVNRLSEYTNGSQIDADRKAYFYIPGGDRYFTAAWFEQFRHWYLETLCGLAAEREVWIMRPIPEMDVDVTSTLAQQALMGQSQPVYISRARYAERHAYALSLQDQAVEQCGVRLIDITSALCDDQRCYGSDNGLPLYRDEDHLNEFGNQRLTPVFERYFGVGRPAAD